MIGSVVSGSVVYSNVTVNTVFKNLKKKKTRKPNLTFHSNMFSVPDILTI